MIFKQIQLISEHGVKRMTVPTLINVITKLILDFIND